MSRPRSVAASRWVPMRRLLVACTLLSATGVLVLLPGAESAGADHGGALLPDGMLLRGANLTALWDERLTVNGRGQEGALFRSAASVDDTLADLRAHWSDRPVDWVESRHEEGALLSVVDVHAGVQWTASLRAIGGGGTEVIRSVRSLHGQPSAPRQAPLSLPPGWGAVSTLEDAAGPHPSATWILVGDEDAPGLLDAAEAAGWVPLAPSGHEPSGQAAPKGLADDGHDPLQPIHFTHPGEHLSLVESPGPLGLRWATLRWESP